MVSITASLDGLIRGSVDAALRDTAKMLAARGKASQLAVVKTATFVAMDTRDELRTSITEKIDRPTGFTKRSPQMIGANLKKPHARVYIRDEAAGGTPPAKYLQPQAMGGDRKHKRFEKALHSSGHLPAGWYVAPARTAKLNSFGNLTSGTYTKILSDLRANPDPMQNTKAGKRQTYFVMWKGDWFAPELLGIFMRRGRKVTKVLNFIEDAPNYEKRFDFKSIVEKHAIKRAPEILERVLRKELENAKRKAR